MLNGGSIGLHIHLAVHHVWHAWLSLGLTPGSAHGDHLQGAGD